MMHGRKNTIFKRQTANMWREYFAISSENCEQTKMQMNAKKVKDV